MNKGDINHTQHFPIQNKGNKIKQAIALEYNPSEDAPRVIASGRGAEVPADGGRTHKIAAAAYLAKCYLTLAWGDGYEATNGVAHIKPEYMQKVVEYTDVVKASRFNYMADYGDLFLPEYKNNVESVFAVQTSDYADDNTEFGRANWSNMLNGCWGMWSCGWDFHKPSQNLVNAFKPREA